MWVPCCSVFQPVNGCSACRSLVEINFLKLKQLFAYFKVIKSIVYFVLLMTEKVVLASESQFRPANSVRSTGLLVEIHNTLHGVGWWSGCGGNWVVVYTLVLSYH